MNVIKQFFSIEKNLTLSVPEKLKNTIFEIPIIQQTLNITREQQVQSISTWISLERLSNSLLKMPSLLSPFSRYCCLKIG